MDHIVSCMLDAGSSDIDLRPGYIEKPSPSILDLQQQQNQSQQPSPSQQRSPEKSDRSFAWRMYPHPDRKYQLFPKDKQQAPLPAGKGLDPEQAFALAMGQNTASSSANSDKTPPANGLRLRIKEHNLIRRRKVSVPELGPMTTVQEVAMDSPTIPGRPPLHERSISAPGNNWRQHLVDCMAHQPAFDELAELDMPGALDESPLEQPRCSSAQAVLSPTHAPTAAVPSSTLRQPLSPKSLAPLVIPPNYPHQPQVFRPVATPLSASKSANHLRSGSTPMESSAPRDSPHSKTPYTPISANTQLTTPSSAVSAASTLPTPVSAPLAKQPSSTDLRVSPQPPTETNYALVAVPEGVASGDVKANSSTSNNDTAAAAAPSAENAGNKTGPSPAAITVSRILSHRRGQSESGSIMERGRPRKRSASRDGAMSAAANYASGTTATGSPSGGATAAGLKRTASKASKTSTATNAAERRAFEMLPRGFKASDAVGMLGTTETTALAAQALQQAARFEVLRKEDVENLSRELRNLDERTEYLRRTYTSLRAGRRNLHARICQYLRSPRVAKFSHDSILKQEEALAELDTSIDDWVSKLEHAENRRTRVRQKLLEHVAASVTLPLVSPAVMAGTAAAAVASTNVAGVSETLQQAMGVKPPTPPYDHRNNIASNGNNSATNSPHQASKSISTPPRSPTKAFQTFLSPASTVSASPSPQRPGATQVPSTILEQPQMEEAMAVYEGENTVLTESPVSIGKKSRSSASTTVTAILDGSPSKRRVDVESIRIYAGDDVYALLADVEDQITSMGRGLAGDVSTASPNSSSTSLPASAPVATGTAASAHDYFSMRKLSEEELKELHRAHSHEKLHGNNSTEILNSVEVHSSNSSSSSSTTKKTSPPGTPKAKEAMTTTTANTTSTATTTTTSATPSPVKPEEIFLTNAVFQPERSVLVI